MRLLYVALLLAVPTISQAESSQADVKTVQSDLAGIGYDIGKIDGQLGPATRTAIRQYQADWDLEQTGEMSQELLDRLERRHPDTKPRWLKVEGQDCELWDSVPQAHETVQGPLPCVLGRLTGFVHVEWRFRRKGALTVGDVFDGNYLDGKQNGHGSILLRSGQRYDGEFRDNKFNGRGVFTWANGNRYEGEFRDGKLNGHGVLTSGDGSSRYDGEFRDNQQEGRGVITFADGSRFDSEFRDGKLNGHGVMTTADGSRYDGEFRDNKFNGHGVFTWANGNRYEGEFRDGKRDGYGVFTWPGGTRYDGEFRNDGFKGHAVITFPDGDRYEGEVDRLPQGWGKYYSAKQDRILTGNWTSGCLPNPKYCITGGEVEKNSEQETPFSSKCSTSSGVADEACNNRSKHDSKSANLPLNQTGDQCSTDASSLVTVRKGVKSDGLDPSGWIMTNSCKSSAIKVTFETATYGSCKKAMETEIIPAHGDLATYSYCKKAPLIKSAFYTK